MPVFFPKLFITMEQYKYIKKEQKQILKYC